MTESNDEIEFVVVIMNEEERVMLRSKRKISVKKSEW